MNLTSPWMPGRVHRGLDPFTLRRSPTLNATAISHGRAPCGGLTVTRKTLICETRWKSTLRATGIDTVLVQGQNQNSCFDVSVLARLLQLPCHRLVLKVLELKYEGR